MLRGVVRRRRRRRRRRRWAHAPVIHAGSYVDHEKIVAWVPISMHTCGRFPIIMGTPLGGPSSRRSSAIKLTICRKQQSKGSVAVLSCSLYWRNIGLASKRNK